MIKLFNIIKFIFQPEFWDTVYNVMYASFKNENKKKLLKGLVERDESNLTSKSQGNWYESENTRKSQTYQGQKQLYSLQYEP